MKELLQKTLRTILDQLFFFKEMDYSAPEQNTNDVWGKNVIRIVPLANGDYGQETYELENWYIPIKVKIPTLGELNSYDLRDVYYVEGDEVNFFNIIDKSISEFEKEKFKDIDVEDYITYQLCDWRFLPITVEKEDNDDIIKIDKDEISFTLVKYAKVLPRIKKEFQDVR